MVKTNTLSTVTVIPASMTSEAKGFLSRKQIEQLPFMRKVKEQDRHAITTEMQQLAAAKMMHMSSGLAMGKHLIAIKSNCKPYSGVFQRILNRFKINPRTAYRYMQSYENACKIFPEPILKAAMVQGLDFISYDDKRPVGKYTDIVQRLLPPPRNPDPEQASRYCEQLEKTYGEKKKALKAKGRRIEDDDIERDPEFLLQQNFRGIKNAIQHIPAKKRARWFERLVGMSLTYQGVASSMTFAPEAIPEEFNRNVGRPSTSDSQEAVA